MGILYNLYYRNDQEIKRKGIGSEEENRLARVRNKKRERSFFNKEEDLDIKVQKLTANFA